MSHQSELIASDIDVYLEQHENKELLRFITCGSVDDGKSTLIGRLLHDSKLIYEDQLVALKSDSKRLGTTGEEIDLALLVDGLQAEREQGITIDVAYRYFSTARRKFIIADTPGHEQYTRNMATGASSADLAIILIDARQGVQTQTRRHSFIVSLLGIKHTIVAINKMDLIDFSEERFKQIEKDYRAFATGLNLPDIHFVPISALKGDNVVNRSDSTHWYQGGSLMELLEGIKIRGDAIESELRFPVQYVNRPNLNFRGYAGTLASGEVRPGDQIRVLPSGKTSRVKSITTWNADLDRAFAPQSITLTLEDEIDISRGDMIISANSLAQPVSQFRANLVWMNDQPLRPGKRYELKISTAKTSAVVTTIHHRIDVNTLSRSTADLLELNEIGEVELRLEKPLLIDDYQTSRTTGAFILIDKLNNATLGAGMVMQSAKAVATGEIYTESAVSTEERALRLGQKATIVAINSADQALLFTLEKRLFDLSKAAVIELDPKIQPMLRAAGLIVLCETSNDADWLVSSKQESDLYLDTKLSLTERAEMIIEALQAHGII